MKKLLALLVIIIFATSIIVAVENPFSFSLYNQITLKAQDDSQPGLMYIDAAGSESSISYAPDYDFQVQKAVIADEMKCTASLTLAEIYTMAYWIKGFAEIGTGGDSDRIQAYVGMDNTIAVVQDYLNIGINVSYFVQWDAGSTVGVELDPQIVLSGEVPDTGFDWKFQSTVELEWFPAYGKDTDPTYNSFDGPAYDQADGELVDYARTATSNYGEQRIAFDEVEIDSRLYLNWEFFHFFAPENITCTLSLEQQFIVWMPYSDYLEESKAIKTEGYYGVKFGLAGVDVGLYLFLYTEDFLNTSAPLDGDSGSNRDWSGDWIVPTGAWDDALATQHERPNMKIGPKITFGYTKEWFGFGVNYKGYLAGLRRWDEDGLNEELKWSNEVEIYSKFSL